MPCTAFLLTACPLTLLAEQQALDKCGPVPKPQLIERMAQLKAKLHKRLTKMAPWLDLPHSDRDRKSVV